jgi:hypothetical protein
MEIDPQIAPMAQMKIQNPWNRCNLWIEFFFSLLGVLGILGVLAVQHEPLQIIPHRLTCEASRDSSFFAKTGI